MNTSGQSPFLHQSFTTSMLEILMKMGQQGGASLWIPRVNLHFYTKVWASKEVLCCEYLGSISILHQSFTTNMLDRMKMGQQGGASLWIPRANLHFYTKVLQLTCSTGWRWASKEVLHREYLESISILHQSFTTNMLDRMKMGQQGGATLWIPRVNLHFTPKFYN